MDSPWSLTSGTRFGAQQFQVYLENSLVCCTWFAGGQRLVDVANPAQPKEVGYYIPEPRKGFATSQSNDVEINDRGLMYLFDRDKSFDILEFTG